MLKSKTIDRIVHLLRGNREYSIRSNAVNLIDYLNAKAQVEFWKEGFTTNTIGALVDGYNFDHDEEVLYIKFKESQRPNRLVTVEVSLDSQSEGGIQCKLYMYIDGVQAIASKGEFSLLFCKS
ncbi:MAG: hypothetical protein ACRCXZ_05190 [Patescibacteria group bacterium]